VTSPSDNNNANDALGVNLIVTSVAHTPPVVSPPKSSGGGGGRFEWLALGFLALLGANRARRRRLQPRVMSRH
jgi:hypothetical protein